MQAINFHPAEHGKQIIISANLKQFNYQASMKFSVYVHETLQKFLPKFSKKGKMSSLTNIELNNKIKQMKDQFNNEIDSVKNEVKTSME
jgi:hypothetical protein